MSGYLRTIESQAGQTIGLIRENGQVEDCSIVDASSTPIGGSGPGLYFVDKNAAAGGNGSILSPFNTFAAAFAAAASDATTTARPQAIWCTPGTYAAEPPQASAVAGFVLTVVGWNIGGDIAQVPDTGPTLPNIQLTGAGTIGVNLVACNIGTVDVATGEVTLSSGAVASTVTCDVLKALDSGVGAGAWTATTSADFSNCVLGGGIGTAGLATFRNCPQPALPVNVTGAVQIDAFTNAWQAITASTTLQVIDKPAQFSGPVVVPAVIAGSVGYVDTVLGGELTATPQDTPITANPHADLAAAGVGGGFINCRVSAAGTVRCAFLGPIAGGNVVFTFALLRQP